MKLNHLILLFAACILITACTTEESNLNLPADSDDDSLSGTWLAISKATYFDLNDIKVGAFTEYSFAYIAENSTETLFSTCIKYYDPSPTSIVHTRGGDQLQDIGNFYEPFTIINNQTLTHTSVQPLSQSSVLYENTYRKIDTTAVSTGASLDINGPVTANSTTETCIIQAVSEDKASYSYDISIPLDSESMILSIRTTQPLTIGNYVYDIKEIGNSPILYSFFISSFDGSFINTVGSTFLTPDIAVLNITTSDTNLIKGSFSFTSQNGKSYNGEFSFIPYLIN
jgi:hypothetical protein